jgi:lipopolysaccharide/colanic/teichoic acid biosynthesis glycosyltransferase
MAFQWLDTNSSNQSSVSTVAAHRSADTDVTSTPISINTLISFIAAPLTINARYTSPHAQQEAVVRRMTAALDGAAFVFIKPTLEALIVVLSAPIWIPLCAIIALLVWFEDGKQPFFLQTRIGKNGKRFRMLKFRTMVPNAGEVLRNKLLKNSAQRCLWNESYKLKDDPRITRIGRFLRRHSLDELPQVINIILGHMSLVGPRPLPDYHHANLSRATRLIRDQVRPGLTGLWQVSGRSDIGNNGMELWDPFYVRNWSLWLDFDILLRTTTAVCNGDGAY